jgi:hypothetical protein
LFFLNVQIFIDMNFNIDDLILIMKGVNFQDSELGEQDAAAGGGSSGGGGAKPPYPTVTKWETGVTRGPANQVALSKWSDVVKLNRGKANTLL